MDKRGISAVVATVLIILITVVSITIVWTSIIPMIRQGLVFSDLDGRISVVTSEGYTVYDAEKGVAMVQVKRDVDDGVIRGIKILFSINGNSYWSSVVAPDSGLTKVYTFNLSGYEKPESVSVAPIFVVGDSEKEGSVTSEIVMPIGIISTVSGTIWELGSDNVYRKSCLEILNAGESVGDGVYEVLLGTDTILVYCDMTTDGGGWTLVFQRRGGNSYHNVDACGSSLNAFLHNTCGDVSSLGYGDSYSIDVDLTPSHSEYMFKEYDSSMSLDSDDAFIIHYSGSLFPDSTGSVDEIAVSSICDISNANCDSSNTYFRYTGDGWFGNTHCNAGYSTGPYLGNYGYCQNGVSTQYDSNGLFGNRQAYDETKLWAHNNGADSYMERVFAR